MKSKKQLLEYMNEAFDKVWYIRSLTHSKEDFAYLSKDHIKEILKAREKVEQQYGSEWYENIDSWEYGFLSGVLATLRWVVDKNEDNKRFLDT